MQEIRFTQAQMQVAMAHYLNTIVLKQPVKVTAVEYNSSGNITNTFTVKTAEPDSVVDGVSPGRLDVGDGLRE